MEKEHSHHHTSNYDRFMSGEYCNSLNPEVLEMISNTKACLARLDSPDLEDSERTGILRNMLGSIGQRSAVGRNFLCQCGKHIFIGDKSVINDNCTMMDENHIRIGDQVLIAPNVQFYTATHPIDYNERFVENWDENSGELFFRTRSLPITVEDNVWIGGGSIILAGITIGTGSVIGAGSVVTKSIPANCVALGNPCRVIRYLKSDNKIRILDEKDIPQMKDLFRTTVLNVNSKDYTEAEVMDWVSCGDNEVRWKELLVNNRYVGAFNEDNVLVGFSSMNKDGYLNSMFVHKDFQHKGIATQLLSEVERIAVQYGVEYITCEVSLTARTFFEKKGYEIIKIQKYKANKLELTNFVMRKALNYE